MWVRAVATALAVWCVSGAANAAGYAEVWNPPEASKHAAKPAKKKKVTAKGKPIAGSKGGKPSAHHDNVKKVALKGGVKTGGVKAGGVKAHGAGKTQAKPALVVRAQNPHAQLLSAKAGQGKVMHANFVQRPARGQNSHPQVVRTSATTGASKRPVAHATSSAPSANVSAHAAGAAIDPATASSGSLPPIIH